MLLSIPFAFQRPTVLSLMTIQQRCSSLFPRKKATLIFSTPRHHQWEIALADLRCRRRCYHNHLQRRTPLLKGWNPSTLNTSMTIKQVAGFFLHDHQRRHYLEKQTRFLHDAANVIRGTMVRATTTTTTSVLNEHNNNNNNETCWYSSRRRGLALNDLRVGQYAEMERIYTRHDVETFSCLIGDYNPLHQEWRHPASAATTASSVVVVEATATKKATTTTRPTMILPNELLHHPLVHWNNNGNNNKGDNNDNSGKTSKILVHGMLVASVFSGILGTLFPGSVYRGQSLQFRNPVFCHDRVVGRVTITAIKSTRRQRQQQETTEISMQEKHDDDGLILMCDTQVLSAAAHAMNEQRNRGNDDDDDDDVNEDGDDVKKKMMMKDPNGDCALKDEHEEKVVEYIRGKATVWLVP